jgi:hypothetical protein
VRDVRPQPRRVFVGDIGVDGEVDFVDYHAAKIRSTIQVASNGMDL